MQLNYQRLKNKPHIFLRLTGTTIKEFEQMVDTVKPLWDDEIESNKKRPGRTSQLKYFEDKLLVLLIYYRTYITEQPTQRPKKKSKQRKYYSGKKKRHTLKAEIVMQDDGRIMSASRTRPGRTHDFRIRKEGKPLNGNSEKYVDSGYQGLQKRVNNVVLPFKRRKNSPLTYEQKKHNKSLSSVRIRVENKIREIKTFKIMAETYRNFQIKHNLRFNIIAGIVNLKHAF